MSHESAGARLRFHLTHPLPLLQHLLLRTESHAYCAGLGFFALVAFYPFCLLLLSVPGYFLPWDPAETVIREALREYYPEAQTFLVRNLEVSMSQYGRQLTLPAALWIVLGAAGVFVPLETAFNQLWGASEHRPYWRNQAVGFLLTTAFCSLAFLFVFTTAGFRAALDGLTLPPLLDRAVGYAALRLCALALAVTAIFLLYRFLPNCRVVSREVWPSAVAAGVVSEAVRWIFLQVLPLLHLRESQGPYYVSVSFALLAYIESFVLLGGAYVAARPANAAPAGPATRGQPPPGPEGPTATRQ